MEAAIRVQGLTRYYGTLLAVDHVDFEVSAGEIFGFLGPNGAGKTTTIRMLTGLLRPSAGGARVMGHDVVREATAVKKRTGVVPESSNLYDELSCLENLLFMGQLYGIPRSRRRVAAERALAALDLVERADAPFRALSRGLKRRLTIAAALVHEPALVFLDEPTAGLDVLSARAVREIIRRLRARGVTVFLTTHNIEEAGALCDRIALIVKGRIVALDTPANLRRAADGAAVLEVTLAAPAESTGSRVAVIPGVEECLVEDRTLRVRVADVGRVFPRLARVLAEAEAPVMAFNTVRPSLEDAFVRLTGVSKEAMLGEKSRR